MLPSTQGVVQVEVTVYTAQYCTYIYIYNRSMICIYIAKSIHIYIHNTFHVRQEVSLIYIYIYTHIAIHVVAKAA